MLRVAITVVVGVLGLAGYGGGRARADAGVTARDAADTFVVDGSARAPGSSSGSDCRGCAQIIWIPACLTTSPTLVLSAPGQACPTVGDETCRGDRRFLREWTAGADGWMAGDARCREVSGGVSLAVLASMVRQSVAHRVPAVRISRQPAGRPLVSVPVLFHSGQPDGELSWRDTVAGVSVTTHVAATWQWVFGDGAGLRTGVAGSRWPDTSVAHAYAGPGRYSVDVTARWSGSFEVAGLGEMPIDGVVTQQSAMPLTIATAGARFRPVLP